MWLLVWVWIWGAGMAPSVDVDPGTAPSMDPDMAPSIAPGMAPGIAPGMALVMLRRPSWVLSSSYYRRRSGHSFIYSHLQTQVRLGPAAVCGHTVSVPQPNACDVKQRDILRVLTL